MFGSLMVPAVAAGFVPAAATPLRPDYSWVTDALSGLSGGWLAVCLTVAVGAFAWGVVRWVLSKVTASRIDDVDGAKVLVAVIVGALALGLVPSLVGFGVDAMGSSSTPAPAQYSGPSTTPPDSADGLLSNPNNWKDDSGSKDKGSDGAGPLDGATNAAKDAWNSAKDWLSGLFGSGS